MKKIMRNGLTQFNWSEIDRLLALANKEQIQRIKELCDEKLVVGK